MKRSMLITLAVMLILTLGASTAFAASIPTADATVRGDNPSTNYGAENDLRTETDAGNCTANRASYLKFDLTAVSREIGRATLTLTTEQNSSNVTGTTVSLYRVATDSWTEAGIVWTGRPARGTLIQAVTAPTTHDQKIVFGSGSASSALATYLQAEAIGDNVASFVLELTGTCDHSDVRFDSKESTTAGNRPTLEIYTPNAVTLSGSSAESVSWPLYAGLGALSLFVVAGVAVSRRRTV